MKRSLRRVASRNDNQEKNKTGFTLIEFLVTTSIIMIMLGVVITYSQQGESINKLNRNIERISFDIRRVENLSMQTKQIDNQKICG